MEDKTKDYLQFIKSRRSIRNYVFKKISENVIKEILDCGRWSPSGLNNQPWKVCVVVHPTVKRMLAEQTKDTGIIDSSFACIVVFLDLTKSYDRTKDILGIGAFMENILLAIHAYPNLGGVWLGEILKNKDKVREIFKLSKEKYELMGVIAFGMVDETILQRETKDPRERIAIDKFTDWF